MASNSSTGTQDETNSTSSPTTGSAANSNDSTDDVGLNELSPNHNNALFAGTVAGACNDAMDGGGKVGMTRGQSDLETEQIGNTTSQKNASLFRGSATTTSEDREYLLSNTGSAAQFSPSYAQAVDAESANLWNKAMTTLAKGKCSKSADESDWESAGPYDENNYSPAYDMGAILDGSINGGVARPQTGTSQDGKRGNSNSPKKRSNQQVSMPSDYSLGGESGLVWTDDVEENYFKYMMDQEQQHRAEMGKDQDDSLLGGSTREELLNAMATGHQAGGTSTFDEDDTTLGHGSKIFGWDHQTAVGTSAAGGSTLTPSLLKGATLDKDGQLIIPNVIYVSDGSNPDPKVKPRFWSNQKSAVSSTASPTNNRNNKSKKQPPKKQLDYDDGLEDANRNPKSPCHANRILIGAAVFFLLLTTGLVAALIIYRNHYNSQQSTNQGIASSALEGNEESNSDPNMLTPTASPTVSTPFPTVSFGKKGTDDDLYDGEDEEEELIIDETNPPTAEPTALPTSAPSSEPTFTPSASPTEKPSTVPTEAPSSSPTTTPSSEPTATPSAVPSGSPSEQPTPRPSVAPTSGETFFPTDTFPIFSPTEAVSSNPTEEATSSPTEEATSSPTEEATSSPTDEPTSTDAPTGRPTEGAFDSPSASPTRLPTVSPTAVEEVDEPTASPTAAVNPVPWTLVPTPGPSKLPPVPSYVAFNTVRDFILEYSPMSRDDLFNEASDQFAALRWLQQWMASIPARVLGGFTKKRLVQRWALAVLFFSTDGPNWANPIDWLSELDVCDWLANNNQGFCDGIEVVSLDLSSNFMFGTLPKELSLLSNSLTRLELDRNEITGTLPEEYGRLTKLVSLDFTRCDLIGTIPTELGNLGDLAILGLGRNDFDGKIPTELGNLQNLVYLGLERNDVSGTIPLELTSLSKLEYLALDWNALTGSVPSEFANLSRLRTFILARNSLRGDVPEEFCSRQMDFLAADCEEVSCPCCDLCCESARGCASTRRI